MSMQINLDKACSVCLQESINTVYSSIFDFTNDRISIQEKIIKCFPSYEEVKYEYPDKICNTCLEDLNAAYRFYNNCEQTSSLLLQCTVLGSIQSEEVKEIVTFEEVNQKQSISTNESFSSSEEVNKIQLEEFSDVEQIDYDNTEDNVIHEVQSCIENSNVIISVVKTDLKDHVLRRFKSKISKTNRDSNRYINKNAKSTQTLKNTPKICELCGNSYKYQHALTAHMRRHLNDRPFKCEFCEKKFVSNVELRRHMRVHTGQKPYACNYCGRCFSDFGSRVKHERIHTGERPFVCETCNKSFAYAHVLTVHLRTHTGEKKYKCIECERGFTKKAYLAAHMQQHNQSAEIEAKDKEIHKAINLRQEFPAVPSESTDKCVAKTWKCTQCNEGFSKKSTLVVHMAQCNNKNSAMSELKQEMSNLVEPFGDCITAYIIEEDYEGDSEQLGLVEHKEQLGEN